MISHISTKWFKSSTLYDDPEIQGELLIKRQMRPIDVFINFRHKSPIILQLIDNINQIALLPSVDIQYIIKCLRIIEILANNKLNQILIERSQGALILFVCLQKMQNKQLLNTEALASFLNCIASCLRIKSSVKGLLKKQSMNFLKIIQIVHANIDKETVVRATLRVLRQIFYASGYEKL